FFTRDRRSRACSSDALTNQLGVPLQEGESKTQETHRRPSRSRGGRPMSSPSSKEIFMSRMTSRLALWVLFVGMTGCQKSEPPPTIGEKQASIVHAEVDTDDPYVGTIGTCTATLIGRRTALTAANCAVEGAPGALCHYPFA